MKQKLLLSVCFCILGLYAKAQYDESSLDKLNWKLSCQAYTFNRFTLEETLIKLNQIGIKYIELYPNQRLNTSSDETTHFKGGKEGAKRIKTMLDAKNIKASSYGVISPNKEEDWIELFNFVKELGIPVIISEPPYNLLDLVENLADKYNIKVAIHNHPMPTPYWEPEITLTKLEGRSSKLGVCADVGHFVRSGLCPMETVKKLRNRIFCFHIKDINQVGIREAHDLPWGTGQCNIPGILSVAMTLGTKAGLFFTIEYEYNWEKSQPEVTESVDYFYRVTHWMTADY